MRQILQNIMNGKTEIADIPCPRINDGHLLIRTSRSLVSVGTERMLVNFSKAGPIEKARQQPDKVRMVIDKIKTDGLLSTITTIRNKLEQELPLGYCNVGKVIEVGKGVNGFVVGDRVISNGKHAEVVSVPVNLCAKVPELVSDDEAAFTVISAIGLQGIRLVQPTMGETVAVIGLGLIGLITVQLLRAHGCRVIGIDYDSKKLTMAGSFGAESVNLSAGEDPIAAARSFSHERGVDAVLITAATDSNEPLRQAALMSRKRGRIVLVGVAGLELSRADFYEKELSFQVSCSYGPGRYDPLYEEKGQDYPLGFVRWTEQRNFEAVLDVMALQRLDVKPLISHRFPITEAETAYKVVSEGKQSLGILFHYPSAEEKPDSVLRDPSIKLAEHISSPNKVTLGLIGTGNYATSMLLPAFQSAGVNFKTTVSNNGVSGMHAARKYGFEETTTDPASVLNDPHINTVAIATRHNSHAEFVRRVLNAGKHVFVEKPLCLTLSELAEVNDAYIKNGGKQLLMVGFNRRFSPHVQKIKSLLSNVKEAKTFIMTVNAGLLPGEHWVQDKDIGGGRIVGEACHFIDLLRFLAGTSVDKYETIGMKSVTKDTVSIQLSFLDGSIGTIHYFANGSKSFPKERLEVFCSGRVLQLDNFRRMRSWGWPSFKRMNLWRQDKGQGNCVKAFVNAIERGESSPIPFAEILEVSRLSIEIAGSLQ